MRWEIVDWINLAQDKDQRWDLVKIASRYRVPWKKRSFLTKWTATIFPKTAQWRWCAQSDGMTVNCKTCDKNRHFRCICFENLKKIKKKSSEISVEFQRSARSDIPGGTTLKINTTHVYKTVSLNKGIIHSNYCYASTFRGPLKSNTQSARSRNRRQRDRRNLNLLLPPKSSRHHCQYHVTTATPNEPAKLLGVKRAACH